MIFALTAQWSVQEMTLFLVWDSEGFTKTTDVVVESIFSAVENDEDVIASREKTKRKREPSSSGEEDQQSKSSAESKSSSSKVPVICSQRMHT